KLHEDLFTPSEGAQRTENGRAWHVAIAALEPAFLDGPQAERTDIREAYESYVVDAPSVVEAAVAAEQSSAAAEAPALPSPSADIAHKPTAPAEPVVSVNAAARLGDGIPMLKEKIR
ncbi:MAG: hypothetical protein L0H93_22870, partial [Nocardioides sp.]|nr:hypothetical protein [Nocardioides sp.]